MLKLLAFIGLVALGSVPALGAILYLYWTFIY
jgi:hypothetical protein